MPSSSESSTPTVASADQLFPFDEVLAKCHQMMEDYWRDHPDLKAIIEQKKSVSTLLSGVTNTANDEPASPSTKPKITSAEPLMGPLRGKALRTKMRESHRVIRENVTAHDAAVISRTQAHNRKCAHMTLDGARQERAELLAAQLKTWRRLLPALIRRFSKLPDHRRATHTKHKITVLMLFGLFAFVFKLQSRRKMNRELTGPVIFSQLQKIFPELDSIPHADTLARVLEPLNPKAIEAIQIGLIRDLLRKKKFKRLLIQGCLPVSIDGTQKLWRHDLHEDIRWCERTVGYNGDKQQYIYVLEANLTFSNGLVIPLMTEYLYRYNNQLEQPGDKKDSETTAIERLAERLKRYFPRLKILIFTDPMFATQSVLGLIDRNHWEYVIKLPQRKLTDFAKQLREQSKFRVSLPLQSHYRGREQSFYWINKLTYGYEWQLTINLVACLEKYQQVNPKTGDIEDKVSVHAWLSSFPAELATIHEIFNLGARKQALIEDIINTEKNRGYRYKHAFSSDWNTMQGFHYLMRLGHAINAISEFTKTIKRYVKSLGCSATLKMIKETLFNPWLPLDWYQMQTESVPQLKLQLE